MLLYRLFCMPKQVIPEHKKGDMRSEKRVIYMRIIYFPLFIYTIRTRLRQKLRLRHPAYDFAVMSRCKYFKLKWLTENRDKNHYLRTFFLMP